MYCAHHALDGIRTTRSPHRPARSARYVADADADHVGHDAFESADHSHLQTAAPPGANGDEGLGGADGEVREERDDGRRTRWCEDRDRP